MATSSEVILLKDEKLRQLAQLIRNHEVLILQNLKFNSIGDQFEYLRMCNSNQESVNTLLDFCNALVVKYKNDVVRGPIAGLILVYAEHCLNSALQLIRNYTLRKSYLDKINNHMHKLSHALVVELDASNPAEVAEFAEQIQQYDRKTISYMKLRANTYASQEFSSYLKNIGIGFNDLIRRYQEQLGFVGRFKDLDEEQKLEVYSAIIEASGRLEVLGEAGLKAVSYGKDKVADDIGVKPRSLKIGEHASKGSDYSSKIKKAIDYGEKAMFMYDVATIAWDIYASNHPIETATREAIELAAGEGGAVLGEIVAKAVVTRLLAVEATSLFVTAASLVGGIVGGFILGAAAGFLFDLIFGSGGEDHIPTEGVFYVAEMPNGMDLAKKIAYI